MWETSEDRLKRLIKEEKDHLWKRVNELGSELEKAQSSLSTLEKTAPEHFSKTVGNQRKTAEIKNKATTQFEAIQEIVKSVEEGKELVEELKKSISSAHETSINQQNEISQALATAESQNSELAETKLESESTIQGLKDLIEEKNLLSQRIETVTEQVESSEKLTKTLKTLLTSATSERKEIRQIYDDVFGHSYEDEFGEVQQVEGLKEQLESSYQKIKDDLSILSNELSKTIDTQSTKLEELVDIFNEKTDEAIASANDKYQGIVYKIDALLPTALTAGLSGAYVEKIKVEKIQLEKHEKSFFIAIVGLIICSSIPLMYSVFRVLFQGQEFVSVIKDTPTIFSLMLPVYAPILWVAYSSNKSYKLSKRLIEEYTHKEVSSKTFEGLSTQISKIGEDESSGELRTRLLFNLLQVNSENPGKLISDYNNSDHPIIDAIDKSSKLADAINKLDNVPLVGNLLKHLNAKAQAKVEQKADEARVVLDAHVEGNLASKASNDS
ncbi:hypothetical protein AB4562_00775 [Vibrio sp. 10N.222.54.A1]|uniref:Uncharacterized protein n=2 Tax=Vibrio TaxID=662 RepID=A0A7Z1MG82_9VIBR|nr:MULTISPECIES: hypothetical protein [Vibrio]PMK82285.1 hypothetical protein BCT92_13695 [Vibrio sp. 10N.261.52.E5]PMP17395.1 hypothetical protein BCS91_25935 [Vibrio cyclitrophicus]PMP25754.1 hypothetical protein BCS90_24605 [Vibrio cyclitrophicus]TKF84897.1 hypothetical protein FCV65_04095 [Vibrio sp. F13]